MDQPILVTKANQEKVPFSTEKLRRSLERAGANDTTIVDILNDIKTELYDGIQTKTIYQRAFALLRIASHKLAAKYKLKQAIMELGPSGYPFEKFVGSILHYQGYEVEIGQIIEGHCVNHEVDVIARKDHLHIMVECKYHSNPGTKSDVKIPLYIHSRFMDIEKAWQKAYKEKDMKFQGWLVTNTKFTLDAIQYGTCVGLTLVGWDHPQSGSLKERIDISGLYPITCLNTLSKGEKQKLLSKMVVLCREIVKDPDQLKGAVHRSKMDSVLEEAAMLVQALNHQ